MRDRPEERVQKQLLGLLGRGSQQRALRNIVLVKYVDDGEVPIGAPCFRRAQWLPVASPKLCMDVAANALVGVG